MGGVNMTNTGLFSPGLVLLSSHTHNELRRRLSPRFFHTHTHPPTPTYTSPRFALHTQMHTRTRAHARTRTHALAHTHAHTWGLAWGRKTAGVWKGRAWAWPGAPRSRALLLVERLAVALGVFGVDVAAHVEHALLALDLLLHTPTHGKKMP